MATHSGLTRWQSFPHPSSEDPKHNHSLEFGEMYPRATDEVWYRRAVEQHYMEPSSFVFSVGFDAGDRAADDPTGPGPLVTATHAVFHTVDERSAPAAVVGFQFYHSSLQALFTNITSTCGESVTCLKTCKAEEVECYVVDNNGFIVVSEVPRDAGRFFGEVKPSIMRMLVTEKIYRQVHITDYQAVCFQEKDTNNPASHLLTPFTYLRQLLSWLFAYIVTMWQQASFFSAESYAYSYASDEVYQNYEGESESANGDEPGSKIPPSKAKERDFDKLVLINRTRPTPCDQETWLFQLQQYTDKQQAPYKSNYRGCERPYVVQQVSGSNLVLVVVDALCPQDESDPPIRVASVPVPRNSSLPCERAARAQLSRRRLNPCIRHHPNESEIELCGRATHLAASWALLPAACSLISIFIANLMIHPAASPSIWY